MAVVIAMVGTLALAGAIGCSDSDGNTAPDSGVSGDSATSADSGADVDSSASADSGDTSADAKAPGSDGAAGDSGGINADAALPTQNEQEPNDGKQTSQVNAITLPVRVSGAIGSADDTDIFTLTVAAGDRFVVHVTPGASSKLEPHLAVFADKTPPVVNSGGGALFAEYYALRAGTVFIALRDRRNVGSGSQGVGDPSMTYEIRVTRLTRAPIVVSVGGADAKAKLDPPGTLRVFSFKVAANDDVDVTVLARRLSPPSDVDTRLSLFSVAGKTWLGTNDDLTSGQSDSLLGGKIPFAGEVHVIIANVAIGSKVTDIAVRVTKN